MRRMKWMLALAGIVVFAWGSYLLGRINGSSPNDEIVEQSKALRLKVTLLEKQKAQLLEKFAILKRTTEVEYQAYKKIKQSLNIMEIRMMELNEELSFYKSIISPSDMQPGVNVQDLRISESTVQGKYPYRLVLTQNSGHNQIVRGSVRLKILGEKDGKSVNYSLNDLSNNEQNLMEFSFKYFQRFEGNILIPEGFKPIRLIIQINIKGKRLRTVQQSYNWNKVLMDGV